MTLDSFARLLSRRAHPAGLLAAGLAVLLAMELSRTRLRDRAYEARAELAALGEILEEARQAAGENQSLRDLKGRDLAVFKAGLPRLAQSRRTVYEGGIQLQEEMRMLQKQWEIMSTYLLVDEDRRQVHLMRGEQSLESYPVDYAPPKAFGAESRPLPDAAAIASKERFAHPERGTSEQVDGELRWEPPQVGSSQRSNALGEYVMFTRGPLILHGPPRKSEEHAAFKHACLGLGLPVARRLYTQSYLGTRVLLRPPPGPPARR